MAPIDRCDFVPVPGKPGTFVAVDKVTREVFNVSQVIEAAFAAGNIRGNMKKSG